MIYELNSNVYPIQIAKYEELRENITMGFNYASVANGITKSLIPIAMGIKNVLIRAGINQHLFMSVIHD